MEKKRRGRPPKKLTFSEAVDLMIAKDNEVNWQQVAKKQETELKIIRNENEDLAKICVERWVTIQDKEKIIKYLEGRIENLAIRSG